MKRYGGKRKGTEGEEGDKKCKKRKANMYTNENKIMTQEVWKDNRSRELASNSVSDCVLLYTALSYCSVARLLVQGEIQLHFHPEDLLSYLITYVWLADSVVSYTTQRCIMQGGYELLLFLY
jgi:hypothetical protein